MKLIISRILYKTLHGRYDRLVRCTWRGLMLWTRVLTADKCEWQKWTN